jgi:hypothetical protein
MNGNKHKDALQRILYTAWKNNLRRHRREAWEAGKQPECREHPGVKVDRFHWITSSRMLCRDCIKAREKYGRQLAAHCKRLMAEAR